MKKALFILVALLMVAGLVALALPTGTQATTDKGISIEPVNPQAPPGYYTVQYELLDGSITLRLANASVNSTDTQPLPSASMTLYISNTTSPDGCDYRTVFIDASKFSAGTVHFGNFSGLLPGNMNLELNLAEDAQGKLYVKGNCSNVSVSSETTKGGSPDETVYTIGDAVNDAAGSAIIGTDSDTAKFGGDITIGGGPQTYLPLYSIVTTKHSKNHVNSAGTLLNNATLEGDGVHFVQSQPGCITDYVGTQGTLVLTGAALDQLISGNPIEYQFKIIMTIGKVSVTPTPTATTPKYNLTVNQASSCCNVSVAGHANASGTVVAGTANTFTGIPQNTVLTVNASFNTSCNAWNGWTGGVGNSSAMNTNVTMSGPRIITAGCANVSAFNLTVDQSLSCCNVSVTGHVNASGTVAAGTAHTFTSIPFGTGLTVTALYNGSCNAWNNWSGNVTNVSDTSTTVTMNQHRTITARCANVSVFRLTVNQAGSCCNVTVIGSGITTSTVSAGSTRIFNVSPGTVVNVSAVYSGTCNTWNNWIGDVANASAMSTTVEMVNVNKSVTANCTYVAPTTTKYNLTVNQNSSCCNVTVSGHANASGAVVAGSSNTFYYIPQNTVLTVAAVFNGSCNYLSGWTGGVASSSAMNTTVNMSQNRTITAGCANVTLYRLTVNQAGSCCNVNVVGHGTVNAGSSNFWDIPSGTVVNLSAAYNGSCNHWNNWTSGVLNASAMSTAVNMTANRTITAGCTYVAPVPPPQPKYSLTVDQTSSCCNVTVSGHVNASGTVNAGATTTFSNIPSGTVIRVNASFNASCDTWGNWSSSVANVSAMNTTVTMSANRSITANCTYTRGMGQGGGVPSWLWPVVGVMIFLTLVLFGYAANRAGWIGKPKGWFGGGMEEYTADGFGEEDVYDKLYGETGGIEKGTGGGSDMHDDEL